MKTLWRAVLTVLTVPACIAVFFCWIGEWLPRSRVLGRHARLTE